MHCFFDMHCFYLWTTTLLLAGGLGFGVGLICGSWYRAGGT
jgi:hypothetical protein